MSLGRAGHQGRGADRRGEGGALPRALLSGRHGLEESFVPPALLCFGPRPSPSVSRWKTRS